VLSFSTALSEEVRGSGVRVLALCPGPVPTGFQKAAGASIAPRQKRAVLSAEDTVERGLRAYEAGDDVCIPGAVNRLTRLATWLLRLDPDQDDPPDLAARLRKAAGDCTLDAAVAAAWQATRERFLALVRKQEALDGAEVAEDLDAALRDSRDPELSPERLSAL